MAVRTEKKCSPELSPCLQDESLIAYIRMQSEAEGYSLKTNYALSIATQLIANEKEIFKRIPSELYGELLDSSQKNVEASLVARANESPVRQDREGLAPDEVDSSAPFLDWDRQEAALEAWARSRGCWMEDPLAWAEKTCDKQIAEGSESKIFRYTGNSVLKVLACPFNPQETLDRIAINNTLLQSCRLDIVGLGRNKDGEFCFLLRQPFIIGDHVDTPAVVIEAFKDFEDTGDNTVNPDFATERYLLGDLHDRNLIQDEWGNVHVIDCNLFLNTPHMGKGGRWIIPAVDSDPAAVEDIDALLDTLVPKNTDAQKLCANVEYVCPGFTNQIRQKGHFEGAVSLPLKGGVTEQYCFQVDPGDESRILYSKPSVIRKILDLDCRFSDSAKETLSQGKTVKTSTGIWRFDLHRGAVMPAMEGRKLRLAQKQYKTKHQLK